jgi:hypothetical protein
MTEPQPLGRLLPGVLADLARRHGINPPTTLADRTPMTDQPTKVQHEQQPLEQFVEWFRDDLAYKAPETWPGHVSWFLDTLVERYGGAA